jgi:hypothetical protein
MKTKATWKPIGHSASKWNEMTQHRGSMPLRGEARPPKKKGSDEKPAWRWK